MKPCPNPICLNGRVLLGVSEQDGPCPTCLGKGEVEDNFGESQSNSASHAETGPDRSLSEGENPSVVELSQAVKSAIYTYKRRADLIFVMTRDQSKAHEAGIEAVVESLSEKVVGSSLTPSENQASPVAQDLEKVKESFNRILNSAFRRRGDKMRVSISANHELDDDLIVMDFINLSQKVGGDKMTTEAIAEKIRKEDRERGCTSGASSTLEPTAQPEGKNWEKIYDAARYEAVNNSSAVMPMTTGVGHHEGLQAVADHAVRPYDKAVSRYHERWANTVVELARANQAISLATAKADKFAQLAIDQTARAEKAEAANQQQTDWCTTLTCDRDEVIERAERAEKLLANVKYVFSENKELVDYIDVSIEVAAQEETK